MPPLNSNSTRPDQTRESTMPYRHPWLAPLSSCGSAMGDRRFRVEHQTRQLLPALETLQCSQPELLTLLRIVHRRAVLTTNGLQNKAALQLHQRSDPVNAGSSHSTAEDFFLSYSLATPVCQGQVVISSVAIPPHLNRHVQASGSSPKVRRFHWRFFTERQPRYRGLHASATAVNDAN